MTDVVEMYWKQVYANQACSWYTIQDVFVYTAKLCGKGQYSTKCGLSYESQVIISESTEIHLTNQ